MKQNLSAEELWHDQRNAQLLGISQSALEMMSDLHKNDHDNPSNARLQATIEQLDAKLRDLGIETDAALNQSEQAYIDNPALMATYIAGQVKSLARERVMYLDEAIAIQDAMPGVDTEINEPGIVIQQGREIHPDVRQFRSVRSSVNVLLDIIKHGYIRSDVRSQERGQTSYPWWNDDELKYEDFSTAVEVPASRIWHGDYERETAGIKVRLLLDPNRTSIWFLLSNGESYRLEPKADDEYWNAVYSDLYPLVEDT